MHSLTLMEHACDRALGLSEHTEAWMESYCQICDPASVRSLILMLRESQLRSPCSEEDLRHLMELVKGLISYIKEHAEQADPHMDSLFILSRQLLSRLAA
jgi:hypothetical protein